MSGIRTCFAKTVLGDDSSATKVHEMRHFSKVDARCARRVAICIRFLADATRIPEGSAVGTALKIILQNC